MKMSPMSFTTPMVLALLDGSKTQTRRVVKPKNGGKIVGPAGSALALEYVGKNNDGAACYETVPCPYGGPGDQLYARETWQHSNHPYGPLERDCAIFYRADYFNDPHGMDGEKSPEGRYRKWCSSTNMPRWASRITLEIIGVRVERLQDISEADARAEGASYHDGGRIGRSGWRHDLGAVHVDARRSYARLWDDIYGRGSWSVNPLVWVIEFARQEVQ